MSTKQPTPGIKFCIRMPLGNGHEKFQQAALNAGWKWKPGYLTSGNDTKPYAHGYRYTTFTWETDERGQYKAGKIFRDDYTDYFELVEADDAIRFFNTFGNGPKVELSNILAFLP